MSNTIVEALLNKIDLVQLVSEYTELTEDSHGNYRSCCCLHHGTNPTSMVILDEKIVFCHSCGAAVNAIEFYCEMEQLPFYAAVEDLANRYNISLENNQQYQQQKSLVAQNTRLMMSFQKQVDVVEQYLIEKRGLTHEIIQEFNLGYCADENFLASHKNPNTKFSGIIFPIHDLYSRCVGFSKRRTDGNTKPTYVNTFDTEVFEKGSTLYNLNRARKRLKETKRLYVVEGYMDTISGHAQGLACAGYIGGYVTKGQLQLLKEIHKIMPYVEFVFAPDNPKIDQTGAKEVVRIRERLLKYAPELVSKSRFLVWPNLEQKDFNDLHKAGITIGTLSTEGVDKAVLRLELESCENVEAEYAAVEKFTRTIQNVMIKADIAKMLADRWQQGINDVRQFMNVSEDAKSDLVLSEFATVGESIDKLLTTLDVESNGIGFEKIDRSFGGISPKEILLIGAYSKVGKSDLICEILLHSVMRLKMNCIMFSMEMPKEALIRRLLMKLFGVNSKVLAEMLKSSEGATYITKARDILEKYLYIVDTNNLTISDIKYRVEVANEKIFDKPARRVFVDYFQYMKGTDDFEGIEKSAKAMKPFAKELNCELYMLSQFSRADRPWECPSIASFKGGNSMESSFDKAILLWRPSKDPKLSEIDREAIKYQTMVRLESREEMYGPDTFELVYDPITCRLSEK